MTKKSNTTNVTSIKNARPTTFDVVSQMEDDIHIVIDFTSVLANSLLDEDIPPEIGTGLIRVACGARDAGKRLEGAL